MARRPPAGGLLVRLASFCTLLALAALMCGLVSAAFAQARPKLLPAAKPSDCAACHAKGGATALSGKLPLSHTHQLAGVTCKSCHDNPRKAEPAKSTKCLTCHTGDAIFAATAAVKPRNPHGSPHYGKESDCNLCHHQHEKSENFCTQCHKFDFKVP